MTLWRHGETTTGPKARRNTNLIAAICPCGRSIRVAASTLAEAQQLRAFGRIISNGHLYKGVKPVHWCLDCRSALAEAEVEYEERVSPAIDVGFRVTDNADLAARLGLDSQQLGSAAVDLVIWTTTPWTLPANQAVALRGEFAYVLLEARAGHNVRRLILAAAMWMVALSGVRRARRLITDHGVRGFKFHPSLQAFSPDDRSYYPLYSVIEEAGLPAVFHTGQTGIGAGLPGGRGIKLRLSNPMLLDDVAADFPGMPVILAHPSVPWQDEAISIATHKANVYIDLSGWSPKYFPPQLVRAASSLLQDKVLFGTDYPLLTPERWLRDFDLLEVKPEVRPKILKHNAARLLGLA